MGTDPANVAFQEDGLRGFFCLPYFYRLQVVFLQCHFVRMRGPADNF